MDSLKEVFSFSRAETIALSLLLSTCLIGGGLLLYEHSRQSVPPQLIFESLAGRPEPKPTSSPEDNSDAAQAVAAPAKASETPLRAREIQLSLNINTATADSLALLPFLGQTLSARIVEYRDKHGNYDSVGQLIAVYGIGPKNIEKIRPYLYCQ